MRISLKNLSRLWFVKAGHGITHRHDVMIEHHKFLIFKVQYDVLCGYAEGSLRAGIKQQF